MIVAQCFPGDCNETLMDLQHALYGELVVALFVAAKERYRAASKLLGVQTELWRSVKATR